MFEYGEPVVSATYHNDVVATVTMTYPSLEGKLPMWYTLDLTIGDLPRLAWGYGEWKAGSVSDTPRVYSLLKNIGVWTDVPAFVRRDMICDYASLVGVTVNGSVL
jgi:hypothetical protein